MIVLGRIVAPFGVKGWVRIAPGGDDPESWAEMPTWWIGRDENAADDEWRAVPVLECRAHGSGLIACLEGVDDRDAAEALKGCLVAAPRESLPDPGDDTWYWADLIGLDVVNLADEPLGKVSGLLTTGAHDVLRVVDADGERLIPFVAEYAKEVDAEHGRIRVDWQKDW